MTCESAFGYPLVINHFSPRDNTAFFSRLLSWELGLDRLWVAPHLCFKSSWLLLALSGIVFLLGISGSRPISWEGSISSNFKNPSDVHESVQYSARDIYCLSWLKLYKISERLYAEAGHTGSSYLEHPPKSQLLSLQWRRKKKNTLNKIKEEGKWVDVEQKRLTWCLGFTGKRT